MVAHVSKEKKIWEDVWIPTTCGGCYASCGIRVRRVNGVAVSINGEPDSTLGAKGGLCAKALATLQTLYDPNRRNVPLRRTNPNKGLYEEGNFVEISWEQALDEIVTRMERILSDDPRKLAFMSSPSPNAMTRTNFIMPLLHSGEMTLLRITGLFAAGGAGLHCGNGAHHVTGQYYASWDAGPDWRYCNYAIFFGASQGFGSGHASAINMRLAADARARGMKFVVFDPMCNNTGAKATEWVPILPGTDGAVVLAMVNVILNELDIYDVRHLKYKTNSPYLIGPDSLYVRHKESGKPLVWDSEENAAKEFDDPSVKDYALFGDYEVDDVKCQPSFQLIKEHIKQYTPEYAQSVSTVPTATIRRIAGEFAEAAKIGSTIVIDGVEFPYRPVSAAIFRGGQGHTNSLHTCYAVHILNCILGAMDVPGGTVALSPSRVFGDPNTDRPKVEPHANPDGMLTAGLWSGGHHIDKWPLPPPALPGDTVNLTDIFKQSMSSCFYASKDRKELSQKFGVGYEIEMVINWACNPVMSLGNRDTVADALAEIPFIVSYDLFPTEFAEGFADIVLPGCSPLEHTASCAESYGFYFNQPIASDDFSIHIRQPVVKPQYQRRFILDVLLDISDRLGLRDDYNSQLNGRFMLDEEHKIKPGERPSIEQISDKIFRNNHGEDYGIDWFKEYGYIRWQKKPQEAYWRWSIDARVPIYLHDLAYDGPAIEELAEGVGVHADWEQYTGLVSWFPTPPQKAPPEYDMYCYSYRDTLHNGSQTMELPWLDEVSKMNPFTYNIVINADTARGKGLKDGDIIWIESNYGRKIKGPIKTTEGVHPQCLGIAATAGHWVKGQPIAYGKGVNFNVLMELDLEHSDPTCLTIETSAKVKIYKAN
jgi:molybdopterin-containing oxidoreductase family molybdopterin binding subunit